MTRIAIAAALLMALGAAPVSAASPQPVAFTVQVALVGNLTASTTSGTFSDSSYGRNLSPGTRCSPCIQPLSETKTISVFFSWSVFLRMSTRFLTWSSTASIEPARPS